MITETLSTSESMTSTLIQGQMGVRKQKSELIDTRKIGYAAEACCLMKLTVVWYCISVAQAFDLSSLISSGKTDLFACLGRL